MHSSIKLGLFAKFSCAIACAALPSTAFASSPLNPGDLVIVKSTAAQLYRYEPANGTASPLATVGVNCTDVTLGEGIDTGRAWVAAYVFDSTIEQVDLSTGSVTPFAALTGDSPRFIGLAYHNGLLYTSTEQNSVRAYDAGTGSLLNTYTNPSASAYRGIRFDPRNNRLVLSDPGQGTIDAMTLSGSFSNLVSGLGVGVPQGIAVEPNGNILVSEYLAEVIQRVDIHANNSLSTVASGSPLSAPVGVAEAATGSIYAANYVGGNLIRMNNDGTSVTNLGSIGSPGGNLYTIAVVPGVATITNQPQSLVSCLGASVTFSVGTGGNPALTYQWYFGNAMLHGMTNAQITLANLQATNAGQYSVAVSNDFGGVTSSNAQLVVNDACVDIHMYAGLIISGQAGSTYVVKFTTDLASTNFANWTPLATNTLGESNWFYVDPLSPFSPKRFYGVKLLP